MEDLQNHKENTTHDGHLSPVTSLQTVGETATQSSLYRYIFYAIVGLVLISAAFVTLAMQSIPGDTLYGAKTSVVENVTEKMHFSNKSKTSYQLTLLQHRLAEIKELAKKETVPEADALVLSSHIDTHTASLESLIGESIDSAFPKTEVLNILNEFASVAGAIETIGEGTPKLQSVGDTAENARGASVSLYKKRALSFVQTEAPTDVYAYIALQLKTVKDDLSENTVSKDASENVETYLDRVDPAIAKSDLTKVIVSIAEAYRFIAMEVYSGIVPTEEQTVPDTTQATSTETDINASTTVIEESPLPQ